MSTPTECAQPLSLDQVRANLDLFCASHGQFMACSVADAFTNEKKPEAAAENLVTRTLGVLQGHGIYAMFLWLAARPEKQKPAANVLTGALRSMIHMIVDSFPSTGGDVLAELRKPDGILTNLPQMLLVKRVLEQALIYARYHAKAMGGSDGK
jgi:hypothetical protein